MSAIPFRNPRARHSHADAPDTAADFEYLAGLGEGPEREALVEELVGAWLPMAKRLARRYQRRSESLEDLEQVAALGLVKAVNRYDPSFGTAFEPFAIPTVIGEVKRHFRDHTWDLHVPRRVQELRNKVRTSIQELSTTADDRSPTIARIAEHSGLHEEDVLTGMEAMESFSSLSLDAQLNNGSDDHYSLANTLGETEPRYDTVVAREAVKPCLRALPERERRILYLRFFHDMTQSRIAEEMGISQMHVSRLIASSCQQVRHQVEADALPKQPAAEQVPAAA